MSERELAECANKEEIVYLHEKLKAICDVNRLRILCLLFRGEKCVCDIEEELGISQPLASHHLGVLREAGLIEARREATWSYYSLVAEAVRELNDGFVEILGAHKLPEVYPDRVEC
jgi:ArsR family transcriptional regulator, arsenate/arsenite/antimonite-responsive transcriptional repressor